MEEKKEQSKDYSKAQEELINILDLKYPPVAVKLFSCKGEFLEGVQELDKPPILLCNGKICDVR